MQPGGDGRVGAAKFVDAEFVGMVEQDRQPSLDLVGAEPRLDVPDAGADGGIFGRDVGK